MRLQKHVARERTLPEPPSLSPPSFLPPPPLWRLILAGLAIAGFLYFLYAYQSAAEERAPPPTSQNVKKLVK